MEVRPLGFDLPANDLPAKLDRQIEVPSQGMARSGQELGKLVRSALHGL